jgi:micrococcal nuclease
VYVKTKGLNIRGLIILGVLLLVSSCVQLAPEGNIHDSVPSEDWSSAVVEKVVDGDTVVLQSGEKVRLIGINAPETDGGGEQFGVEAKLWLQEKVEGRKVYLEKDVSDTDQYGRTLRYLWVDIPDGISENNIREFMVNAVMVAEGYAQPYTFPPDVRYADLIMELAREAHSQERGLWGIDPDGTTRGTPLYK